ncbi:MAG: formate dehydrogenase accessory sulfurtransferase FdhD [Chloroflexi bacterium]|nr:formate dehydrogenase accessory sulfurtransferase FdhD [Chloroflexota bacterium]
MKPGIKPTTYLKTLGTTLQSASGEVIDEVPLSLYINGQEWVTLMCTPTGLKDLVLGFLVAEGVVRSLEDVKLLDITHRGQVADVWLNDGGVTLPQRRIVTSGCGGGVTFADLAVTREPIRSQKRVSLDQVFELMHQLNEAAILYRRSQGVHTSALSDGKRLLATAEDVGRHNTLDKLRGYALQQGIPTGDTILLTTGRISSEMLQKAADMGSSIVISRTSPTSLSLELARAWNVTLIGYVRGRRLRVYTGHERVAVPVV